MRRRAGERPVPFPRFSPPGATIPYNPPFPMESGQLTRRTALPVEADVFRFLFLAFICLPLIDLFLLLRVGSILGFWPTVALVISTGLVGAALARWQGISTLARIQSELAAGRMPAAELSDGAMILVAAALLVTPGFVTDVIGLLLLIPPARKVLRAFLTRYFSSRLIVTRVDFSGADGTTVNVGRPDFGRTGQSWNQGPVIYEAGAEAPGKMKYVRNEAEDGRPDE